MTKRRSAGSVRSLLTEIGFHVTESDHGDHALSVINTDPCLDLLVTEARPPGVDAKALIRAFSLRCLLGRSIVLSEQADTAKANAESNGEWAVIAKEGLSDGLLEAIRNFGFGQRQCVILLAEDEPMIRNFVGFALRHAGYAVIDASDGQEALERSGVPATAPSISSFRT